MTSVTEIGQAMKTVLSAVGDQVGRQTGFVKRKSKLTGAKFVQTMVLGWLHKPEASLDELCQTAASIGVEITPQGLDQRFTREAAALLQAVLHAAIGEVIASQPVAIPILQRFNGVIVQDSSIISLPDALAELWQGCGDANGHHIAALKLQVRLDLLNGTLHGPHLENGRTNDRGSKLAAKTTPLPVGALRLTDLGYFSLGEFRAIADQEAFFLSRLFLQTALFDQDGQRLDLLAVLRAAPEGQIDLPVRLGSRERLPLRLLAVRVRQEIADQRRRRIIEEAKREGKTPSKLRLAYADWIILVTNASKEQLSLSEAMVLYRVRWQVELLFKLWKSHGKVDEWRSQNPWRILCEVYAKLIAMVIQHWLLLVSCWVYPNRSLVKATQTVRSYVLMLATAIAGLLDIAVPIQQIQNCLTAGRRMNPRRKTPNAYQLLLDLTLDPLPEGA